MNSPVPLEASCQTFIEHSCGTQASTDMCVDRAIRRCKCLSSASYTLFYVTQRERIHLDFVACLAEGQGSVLAVLAGELRVRQVFCLCELVSPSSLRAP